MSDLILAYVRVSSDEQVEEGHSLDAQIRAIHRYIDTREELKGCKVQFFREEGVSARTPFYRRPKGSLLGARLTAGGVAHIIAVRLDRLFRITEDGLATVAQWTTQNITIHLADEHGCSINTRSAVGKFFLTMRLASAEFESNLTSERTKSSFTHMRAKGAVIGDPGFGWRLSDLDGNRCNGHCTKGKHRGHGKLIAKIEVPEEQAVIRDIVAMSGAGLTYEEIKSKLVADGRCTREGGAWHTNTIARIMARVNQ